MEDRTRAIYIANTVKSVEEILNKEVGFYGDVTRITVTIDWNIYQNPEIDVKLVEDKHYSIGEKHVPIYEVGGEA